MPRLATALFALIITAPIMGQAQVRMLEEALATARPRAQ